VLEDAKLLFAEEDQEEERDEEFELVAVAVVICLPSRSNALFLCSLSILQLPN